MEQHAKLLGQFGPEAHFSKMIHTGKKSISLSSDELSVLSVGFNKEAMGEGEQRARTQSRTHTHTHTHTHPCARIHMTTEPSLQMRCSLWN